MYALLLAHNADESAVLRLALQRAGFAARITTDLIQAVQDWSNQPADLVLLSFPEAVPLSLVSDLRAITEVPFLIIANPLVEEQHIGVLETGVDLVVFRPFSARLLIAQLRGLLRRATGLSNFSLPSFTVGELKVRTVNPYNTNSR